MKNTANMILDELIIRYPVLAGQKENIQKAYELCESAYKTGHKTLVCGNGGSAADSEHIVGELMKCFKKKRPIPAAISEALAAYGEEGKRLQCTLEGSLRSVSLTSHIALSTAFANDKDPAVNFAQQLYGLGDQDDVLLSISTSGNSENCVLATVTAKVLGLHTIALTGMKGSKLSSLADVTIQVPETETFKVQELHLPIYHALCAMLEEEFF